MIQRIQSLYFFIAIACLCAITFGLPIFTYNHTPDSYELSSYGIQRIEKGGQPGVLDSIPFFIAGIVVIMLGLLAIFSFKNLKRQHLLGRLFLTAYLLVVLAASSAYFLGETLVGVKELSAGFGVGFFVLVAGLPFCVLANAGIKKDKNLLDSLNRLR